MAVFYKPHLTCSLIFFIPKQLFLNIFLSINVFNSERELKPALQNTTWQMNKKEL